VGSGKTVTNKNTQSAAPESETTPMPAPERDIRYADSDAAVGATNRRRDDDLMAKIHEGQVAGRELNSDAVGLLPEFTPLPLVADDEGVRHWISLVAESVYHLDPESGARMERFVTAATALGRAAFERRWYSRPTFDACPRRDRCPTSG
jgi:hypothetical protein